MHVAVRVKPGRRLLLRLPCRSDVSSATQSPLLRCCAGGLTVQVLRAHTKVTCPALGALVSMLPGCAWSRAAPELLGTAGLPTCSSPSQGSAAEATSAVQHPNPNAHHTSCVPCAVRPRGKAPAGARVGRRWDSRHTHSVVLPFLLTQPSTQHPRHDCSGPFRRIWIVVWLAVLSAVARAR